MLQPSNCQEHIYYPGKQIHGFQCLKYPGLLHSSGFQFSHRSSTVTFVMQMIQQQPTLYCSPHLAGVKITVLYKQCIISWCRSFIFPFTICTDPRQLLFLFLFYFFFTCQQFFKYMKVEISHILPTPTHAQPTTLSTSLTKTVCFLPRMNYIDKIVSFFYFNVND